MLYRPSWYQLKQYCDCCCGGCYFLDDFDLSLLKEAEYDDRRNQISCLLRERSIHKRAPAFLRFQREQKYPEVDNAEPIYVDSWLNATWPRTVGKRIERTLLCLGVASEFGGKTISFELAENKNSPVVSEVCKKEANFLLQSLHDKGLVVFETQPSEKSKLPYARTAHVRLTADGWDSIEKLTHGESNQRNPAFVAMAFGKKSDGSFERQEHLFSTVIAPAINAAGYHAKRADTEEHNEYVMDKILADIRRAPFIVADVSEPNLGVYYEAGVAVGLNIPVITCCEDAKGGGIHFDIQQKSQVRWATPEEFSTRLKNRIVGSSIGPGPYNPEDFKGGLQLAMKVD